MDYKDLADLIFPDAKPIKYYEEKYPERNLPEGAMVVRIGPSPTGSVHIGTIYQALIATMLAKRTNLIAIAPDAIFDIDIGIVKGATLLGPLFTKDLI